MVAASLEEVAAAKVAPAKLAPRGAAHPKASSTSPAQSVVQRRSQLAAARSGKSLLARRLPGARSGAGRGGRCMGTRGMGVGIRMVEAGRILVGEDFLLGFGLFIGGEWLVDLWMRERGLKCLLLGRIIMAETK